jgi:1,4-dihydroxy-2-naphthoate octaprenyltransferase
LQILSNFANDYGDGTKGTDNDDRRPKRAIQSGAITPAAMKRAIIITSLLTLVSAMLLIYNAFADTNIFYSLFTVLGNFSNYAPLFAILLKRARKRTKTPTNFVTVGDGP